MGAAAAAVRLRASVPVFVVIGRWVVLSVLVLVLGRPPPGGVETEVDPRGAPGLDGDAGLRLAALLVPRGHGPGAGRDVAQLDVPSAPVLPKASLFTTTRNAAMSGWMLQ